MSFSYTKLLCLVAEFLFFFRLLDFSVNGTSACSRQGSTTHKDIN